MLIQLRLNDGRREVEVKLSFENIDRHSYTGDHTQPEVRLLNEEVEVAQKRNIEEAKKLLYELFDKSYAEKK